MEFSKYQARLEIIRQSYNLSDEKQKLVVTLGLFEEVGEVVGLVKKSFRDDTPIDFVNLKKELGDVLAYLTLFGQVYDISLEEIAAQSRLNEQISGGILGLCVASGKVVELVSKSDIPIDFVTLKKELGDVLGYLQLVSQYYGFAFAEIAAANLEKLEGRMARNTLSGSGNDR